MLNSRPFWSDLQVSDSGTRCISLGPFRSDDVIRSVSFLAMRSLDVYATALTVTGGTAVVTYDFGLNYGNLYVGFSETKLAAAETLANFVAAVRGGIMVAETGQRANDMPFQRYMVGPVVQTIPLNVRPGVGRYFGMHFDWSALGRDSSNGVAVHGWVALDVVFDDPTVPPGTPGTRPSSTLLGGGR